MGDTRQVNRGGSFNRASQLCLGRDVRMPNRCRCGVLVSVFVPPKAGVFWRETAGPRCMPGSAAGRVM